MHQYDILYVNLAIQIKYSARKIPGNTIASIPVKYVCDIYVSIYPSIYIRRISKHSPLHFARWFRWDIKPLQLQIVLKATDQVASIHSY